MVWASLLSSSPEPTSHRLLVFKYRALDLYLQCVWIHRGLKCPCKNGSHYWRSCHCAILYNYQGWRHSSGHIVSGTRLKGKQSSPREPLAAPKCSTRHVTVCLATTHRAPGSAFENPTENAMDVFFSLGVTCYEKRWIPQLQINKCGTHGRQMSARLLGSHSQNKIKIAQPCTEFINRDHFPTRLSPLIGETGKAHEEKVMAMFAWN